MAHFQGNNGKLACALDSYLSYLRSQNKKMQIHHYSPGIVLQTKPLFNHQAFSASSMMLFLTNLCIIFCSLYAPSDRWKKYRYVQELQKGLFHPCVLCTCSIGGPVGNTCSYGRYLSMSYWKLLFVKTGN